MDIKHHLFPDPQDYLQGAGVVDLPIPKNILLFRRTTKQLLQQDNIRNKSHHRIVIIVNFETTGYIHLDHLEVCLKPEQALVIHPHQFHHFSNLTSSKLNWMICTFELQTTQLIESLRNKVIYLSPSALQCLQNAFDAFLSVGKKEFAADELQTQMLSFLIKLKQDAADHAESYPVMKEDIVSKVNRILIENRNRDLCVSIVAEQLNLSSSRTRFLFKESSGVSLGKYITNYKIHISLALLKKGLSISTIAEESGFASLQAFSRAFRQHTGQTPRDFRMDNPFPH